MSDVKLSKVEALKLAVKTLSDFHDYESTNHEYINSPFCLDVVNALRECDEVLNDEWVKIEDAELVDGEDYWVDHGEVECCTHLDGEFYSVMFGDWIGVECVYHVIHLPKPTHPSEL